MNKWTPGPWNLDCNRWCDEADVWENQEIICAAPDLYEACKTFAEWLRREEEGFVGAGNKRVTAEDEIKWREWYEENLRLCGLAYTQARAALAKARGEA